MVSNMAALSTIFATSSECIFIENDNIKMKKKKM